MYELTIESGKFAKNYKSESLPTLLREVASFFNSHDAQVVPLPYQTQVNQLGQILLMKLVSRPHDPWWKKYHPRADGRSQPLRATLRRAGSVGAPEGYPMPKKLYRGPGKVWVAIGRLGIVDAIYMKHCPDGKDFEQYRIESRDALQTKGKVMAGYIQNDRFIPKLAEAPGPHGSQTSDENAGCQSDAG